MKIGFIKVKKDDLNPPVKNAGKGTDVRGNVDLRERYADFKLRAWRQLYDEWTVALPLVSNQKQLNNAISTLEKTDRILKQAAAFLKGEPDIPLLKVQDHKGNWIELKATELLAASGLAWIARRLKRVAPKRGNRVEAIVVQAAIDLLEISKQATGKPDRQWVVQKISSTFPGWANKQDVKTLDDRVKKFRKQKKGLFRLRRDISDLPAFFEKHIQKVNGPDSNLSPDEAVKNAEMFFELHLPLALKRKELRKIEADRRQRRIESQKSRTRTEP